MLSADVYSSLLPALFECPSQVALLPSLEVYDGKMPKVVVSHPEHSNGCFQK